MRGRHGGRASSRSVVVTNSTTVNLHALLATFLPLSNGPSTAIDELAFPTVRSGLTTQLRWLGRDPADHLRVVRSADGRTIEENAVVDVGEVVAYLTDTSGETDTGAFDVVGVDRTDWNRRYERAVCAHREGLRRKARDRRKSQI